MSLRDNSCDSVSASRRCWSLQTGQFAPQSSTITAIAAAGAAAAATSARWPRAPATSSDRSTRSTAPSSPPSSETRIRDFSGTKPRMAGSAAISAPGRFSVNSGCFVVMPATLTTATVIGGAPVRPAPPLCGPTGNCESTARVACFGCVTNRIGVSVCVMDSKREYDVVVIGSGPGGQKAAIASAKLGKSVAVIERGRMIGGVCVNTGTIPSKTLREAVLYLTGMSQRDLYGASYRVKDNITPADLNTRTHHVIGREIDVVRNQLMRNRVDLLLGH